MQTLQCFIHTYFNVTSNARQTLSNESVLSKGQNPLHIWKVVFSDQRNLLVSQADSPLKTVPANH